FATLYVSPWFPVRIAAETPNTLPWFIDVRAPPVAAPGVHVRPRRVRLVERAPPRPQARRSHPCRAPPRARRARAARDVAQRGVPRLRGRVVLLVRRARPRAGPLEIGRAHV